MYIKYMDFECTARGYKSAESVNKLFEIVKSLLHVWGCLTVFNCIEQGSLVLKPPKHAQSGDKLFENPKSLLHV